MRLVEWLHVEHGIVGFNPRTHTGCDFMVQCSFASLQVSIHAPTRGATANLPSEGLLVEVSIHAPTRGATFWRAASAHGSASFNPRTHTGCDGFASLLRPAPLWFQSTHPHGVRRCSATSRRAGCCFNPRTHTGCDSAFHIRQGGNISFNPRTHTGCDCIFSKCLNINLIR